MKESCATGGADDTRSATGREGGPIEVWLITDGRPGNRNPARALAEGLARALAEARRVEISETRITATGVLTRLPPAAVDAATRLGGERLLSDGFAEGAKLFERPPPDLAIGCGRLSAPVTAALRRRGSKSVQLLNPQMPLDRFDLVAAPAHDRLRGANVLTTVGSLAAPPPEAVDDPRLGALARPLVGVLIGGASRSARFEAADADALIDGLRRFSDAGWGLAATLSNRTPPEIGARLREGVESLGGWLWDGDGDGAADSDGGGDNPYPALLAQSAALVVTADSVNMASEAAALGKPVHIAPLSRISSKLRRFHDALRAGGHARPLTPDTPLDWSQTPLDDLPRAVAAARALLTV